MIIECPACKARAKLPESKEGAKVRCSECSRVYVARPAGSRAASGSGRSAARSGGSNPAPFVIGGVVAVAGLGLFLMTKGKGQSEGPPPVAQAAEAPVTKAAVQRGWDAPVVQAAAKLHGLAESGNHVLLGASLAGEHLWKQVQQAKRDAGEEASDLLWSAIPGGDQQTFVNDIARDMISGEAAELVGNWKPFDGDIVTADNWEQDYDQLVDPGEEIQVVRLHVAPRDLDSGLGNRWVEWVMVKDRTRMLAVRWQRWISPEEVVKEKKARKGKPIKRELTDGSVVIESTIRAIPHDDDTPPELRDEIDSVVAELIGLESKPYPLQQRLQEIGKPAIPALLTQLATIPLETEENAIQLNLVCQTLQDITEYRTTFQVSELMGATKERQESGLMQWFGWYDRKYRRFSVPTVEEAEEEYVDEFEDDPAFKPRSEAERRAIEKAKRERAKENG